MKREIKFPTIVGLILLTISLVIGIYLSRKPVSFGSKASGDCQPINPQITNQTHHSADVFFLSSSDCLSTLEINGQIIQNIAASDAGKIHYFQINNLSQNREYPFKIIANGNNYESQNYTIKTTTQPQTPTPISNLAWGRVFNSDFTPATNAIVYLVIPGALPLSAVVTSSGNWNISLANSFNDQKNNWFSPPDDASEEIVVLSADGQITQIDHTTSFNNPVPDIIVGQNFFPNAPLPDDSGFLSDIVLPDTNYPLTINNPQEGETLTTDNPSFFGTAPINTSIIITIESEEKFQDEILASADGSWQWSPPKSLPPGEHTITISALGQTIKRTFFVFPSSEALAFTASGSATFTPTPIVSPTLPPTSTPVPTATSTPVYVPTSTPTDFVRAAQPSTSSAVPVSGNSSPIIILVTVSLALFMLSFTFFR